MIEFKKGDLVNVKGERVIMTVIAVWGDDCQCAWEGMSWEKGLWFKKSLLEKIGKDGLPKGDPGVEDVLKDLIAKVEEVRIELKRLGEVVEAIPKTGDVYALV